MHNQNPREQSDLLTTSTLGFITFVPLLKFFVRLLAYGASLLWEFLTDVWYLYTPSPIRDGAEWFVDRLLDACRLTLSFTFKAALAAAKFTGIVVMAVLVSSIAEYLFFSSTLSEQTAHSRPFLSATLKDGRVTRFEQDWYNVNGKREATTRAMNVFPFLLDDVSHRLEFLHRVGRYTFYSCQYTERELGFAEQCGGR